MVTQIKRLKNLINSTLIREMPFLIKLLYLLLRYISEVLYKKTGRVFLFSLSPRQPFFLGFPLSEKGFLETKKVALVLQGPINKLNPAVSQDFAKRAKSELGVGIVVYAGLDSDQMSDYVDVAIQVSPEKGDQAYIWQQAPSFILQQDSSLAGLKAAKGLHYEYALKLRADALILRRDAMLQLFSLLKRNDKNKFVVTSHQKPFYWPFMSDHIQFGKTEDLIKLWVYPWKGKLTLEMLPLQKVSEEMAPTPEWVLGMSFQKNFPGSSFEVVTDLDIGYVFPKYGFADPFRFNWESAPHFWSWKTLPSNESNISTSNLNVIRAFGCSVYKEKLYCVKMLPECPYCSKQC